MTSATPPPSKSPNNAAPSASSASQSASDASTLHSAVPAQLSKPSYANATKSANQSIQPKATTPSSTTGASAPVQHGKIDTTKINGQMSTASPSAGPQQGTSHTNINGIARTDSHGRKPSVVISASGATGQIPNGNPAGQNGRPNIAFGSINPSGSPAPTNSNPSQSQTAGLTPRFDPRVISPAQSPTPIPHPNASGGKPPVIGLQQGNGVNFGNFGNTGAENGDMSQNPPTPGQQPAHLRRDPSQSGHNDINGPNQPNQRGGFLPPGGRGRGGYNPQYPSSPAQNYRQLSQRGGPPNFSQFQGQPSSGGPSYGRGRNSPAVMHAQPYMPQGMQNSQMQHGGYPQHLGPQQQQPYGAPYDPYNGYYQPFYPQQQYQHGGPPSPHPGQQFQSPYGGPPQHMPSPYHPPSMSRSTSQISERPASSMGSRPPTNAGNVSQAPTPAPASSTPAPQSSNFQIPSRTKSKAIVIKNAAGEELRFDNKKTSPSPVQQPQPQSPAIVSSTAPTPTPPPRTPSAPQHVRSESKSAKTDAEIKNGFQEQVKRQLEAQREKERKEKEGTDTAAATEKADVEAKATAEKEAADKAASDKAVSDKEIADKAASDKEAADKAAADKAAADKAASDKAAADKAASDKAAADKAASDKAASDKAASDKEAADKETAAAKAKADEQAKVEEKAKADEKAEAEKKAKAEKEELEAKAKAEKEKTDAEAAAQADNARAVTEAQGAAEPEESEEARLKREEDERIEAEIAEMEAAEREEEERERKFQEKRAKEKEEKAKRDADAAANADNEMKRLEREAEELEAKKEREREQSSTNAKDAFAELKKPTLGPGATADSGADTPASEDAASVAEPEETAAAPAKAAGTTKPKPGPLKLHTDKPVEPPQPTPGMQALKSARILDLQKENIAYPDGIKSPNPALNQAAKRGGRQYDMSFLLQFQEVFKEKPTVDWDQKVKDTLGDGEPGSAKPGRTTSNAMGPRQPSRGTTGGQFGGAMGAFGGGAGPAGARTLPPGTTSADRFNASMTSARPTMNNPLANMAGRQGGFPMGSQAMSRNNSLQTMASANPTSPRGGSSRGRGSRRGPADRNTSRREDGKQDSQMPLTAGMELKNLEKSATGWTARSIAAPTAAAAASGVGPDGMMPPDMVQRKVKSALNKMTPEKFDKISDQVIEIANQSKNETDGRTLRQVIQLTFEKACDEAHWAGMYAKFCQKMLTTMSNEIVDETIRDKSGAAVVGGGLFRKYLLNRCQEEFERGWEANLPDKPEGETEEAALLSDEYYIAAAAKRRGLGLIQFIGELYKLSMLTYRIMHQCVLKLLNFEGQPDESTVENLCRLLRTVGATMDNSGETGHGLVNAYFERINSIMEQNKDMPSRPRFMLMDVIDLRRQKWNDKSAQKGPKTIQEIRAEAEAAAAAAELERSRQNQRGGGGGRMGAGRGDARNFSNQGMPPPDYPRNQVGLEDLRKLQSRGAQSRQASQGLGPSSLGPGSSLYAGRSSSGRKGLGPPKDGDASGATSRTSTPPAKKEEKEATHANAFSALAALGNEEAEGTRSPPSEKTSPQTAKATPSIDAAADSAAPPS